MTGTTEPPMFKVVETDGMTGWDRYLDNMETSAWSGTFTREQAEATVKWREEHITRRYSYKIVPVQSHMTSTDEARKRHDDRRGRHGSRSMEDCNDIDCREAAGRLAREEINRRYAAPDKEKADG